MTKWFHSKDVEKALDEVLEERKQKVNPYEGRDLDELEDDLDVGMILGFNERKN